MTEVIILRHAKTEAGGILKGSLDTDATHLSEYGLLTTMVTARAIRNHYRNIPHFYFAYGHYKRTTETAEILGKVVPTSHEDINLGLEGISFIDDNQYNLPHDIIYKQQLLGAEPLKFKGFRERNFGSLEGQKLSKLTDLVKSNTSYPNLADFLLYGSSEDFVDLAKKLDVENPEWGEGYEDVFKRAYRVSHRLLGYIKTIDNPTEESVIVLTTHQIFGNYLINAVINSVSMTHFPEPFEKDKKYSRHFLVDYSLEPCRFARLNITMRADADGTLKPHCTIHKINDRGHLVQIDNMSSEEKDKLIKEAKAILKVA